MWQLIVQNKEWLFSGAGLIFIPFAIWASRRIFFGSEPKPIVDVTKNIALVAGDWVDCLGIKFLNKSNRDVIVNSFAFELRSGETMVPLQDGLTGDQQQKRTIQQGDSFTFYVSIGSLANAGRKISEYKCALVTDALGNEYRSNSKTLKQTIASLLLVKH